MYGKCLQNELTGLETGPDPCYMDSTMLKTLKLLSGSASTNSEKVAPKRVRNPKTGELMIVRGFGALKGSDLKIRKGVNLTKPIAAQALAERREKRSAG
jgi:hypothetical protein